MMCYHVLHARRKIQISLPPGEQDRSNALPQGQQRQSNPHPMPCLPPRRHYIDRCISLAFEEGELLAQTRHFAFRALSPSLLGSA